MKTLKLGIDLDGVLADFTKVFANAINMVAPGTIPPGYSPKDWDWTEILTPEVSARAWTWIKSQPNFWLGLHAFTDNLIALSHFMEEYGDRVEIYYVTARATTAGFTLLEQCYHWLDGLVLNAPYTSIIPVKSGMFKGLVYKAIGIQMSIDDAWTNVANAIGSYPEGEHYLLDRSWNQEPLYNRRVFSMEEFLTKAKQWLKDNE